MGELIVLLILAALYFAPSIVALGSNRPNTAGIVVLNLFLGWTLVGWVIAIVWAVTSPSPPVIVTQQVAIAADAGDTRACPHCAETIKRAAVVCRFCGRDVVAV